MQKQEFEERIERTVTDEQYIVVKNLPDSLEVVSRVSLKKVGGKPKTRTISKSL